MVERRVAALLCEISLKPSNNSRQERDNCRPPLTARVDEPPRDHYFCIGNGVCLPAIRENRLTIQS